MTGRAAVQGTRAALEKMERGEPLSAPLSGMSRA
jgi:hypothetical protein